MDVPIRGFGGAGIFPIGRRVAGESRNWRACLLGNRWSFEQSDANDTTLALPLPAHFRARRGAAHRPCARASGDRCHHPAGSRTTPEEYRVAGPRRRDDSCDRTLSQTVVSNDVGTSGARLRADIRPAR